MKNLLNNHDERKQRGKFPQIEMNLFNYYMRSSNCFQGMKQDSINSLLVAMMQQKQNQVRKIYQKNHTNHNQIF